MDQGSPPHSEQNNLGSSTSNKKSFISDIAWVGRGVAKAVPDKVEIEQEELRQLIQGNIDETTEDDTEEDAMDESTEAGQQGLRGSAASSVESSEGLDKYKLEDYDDDETKSKPTATLKGLACFTTPMEDPMITRHEDSDDEAEREDFEIKPTDNLLVVAKLVREEEATLEVYVYNEERDDWYLHHDYILDAPPLCLATFSYDPGAGDKKGNLLAVGTMDSVINIWDLDIVNAVKPSLTLGHSSLKAQKKRRTKRDGTAQGHSDAVLCLDWNSLAQHVLASGGADQAVVLWDLDEAKASTVISLDSMVQSCRWSPSEDSVLLAGTRGGEVSVLDCRTMEPSTVKWSLGEGVEVEKVAWNRFKPSRFFVVSDDGMLRYADSRKPGKFLAEVMAHEDGVCGLSQSHLVEGLIATVGSKELKVWKLSDSSITPIYNHPVNMGSVNAVSFCPDSSYTLAVGAQTEEMVRLVNLSKYQEVRRCFDTKEEE